MHNNQSENHAEDRLTLTPAEQMFAESCADEMEVNMSGIFYPERPFVLSCEFWKSISDV